MERVCSFGGGGWGKFSFLIIVYGFEGVVCSCYILDYYGRSEVVVCTMSNIHVMKTSPVLVPCENANGSDSSLRYAVDYNVLVVMMPVRCTIAPSQSHNTVHPFSNEEAGDTKD